MAKINPQKFTVEEFKEQAAWIGKLFSALNQFTGSVVSAFSNNFTIEDNFFQEIKEVKWVNSAQNFPLKFQTKFKARPVGIVPIYLFNNTLGIYSIAAPWVVWNYFDGVVSMSNISGLTADSTYTIRLLVVYG